MKITVTIHDFRKEFSLVRPDNFSYEGLEVLFDYLEQYEIDTGGEELELDVIALCCDFSEEHYSDIATYHEIDLSDCEDEEEELQAVLDYLNDEGYGYCGVTDDNNIVYRNF